MTSTLLNAENQPNMMVIFHGENKVVQNNCAIASTDKLRDHRQPNQDLYLEFHHNAHSLNNKVECVNGHQDSDKEWDQITDLKELKLTPAAYLSIWCDWQAELKKNTYLHPGCWDIAGGEMGRVYMLPYLMQNYREIREGDTRIYVHRIINILFSQKNTIYAQS